MCEKSKKWCHNGALESLQCSFFRESDFHVDTNQKGPRVRKTKGQESQQSAKMNEEHQETKKVEITRFPIF